METFLSHAQTPIPKLCPTDTPQAAQLNLLFQKMVAKNPQARISNMAEVAAEFKKIGDLESETESHSLSSQNFAMTTSSGYSNEMEWSLTDPARTIAQPWYLKKNVLAIAALAVLVCIGSLMYMTSSGTTRQTPPANIPGTKTFGGTPPSEGQPGSVPANDPNLGKSKVPQGTATKVFKVED